MVRPSDRGVDLGMWKGIKPSVLHIPLDVHTSNVGRKLGLLKRASNDWKAVEELTASLRTIDAEDPVRLDFALFGLGAIEGFEVRMGATSARATELCGVNVQETKDGSKTLHRQDLGVHYHSVHGAWGETRHVFWGHGGEARHGPLYRRIFCTSWKWGLGQG